MEYLNLYPIGQIKDHMIVNGKRLFVWSAFSNDNGDLLLKCARNGSGGLILVETLE